MLTRQNVSEVTRETYRLLHLERKVAGRTFRRFLERLVDYGSITQFFAYDEGYSAEQLKALEAYAQSALKLQAEFLPEGVVKRGRTAFDEMFGLVTNGYQFECDIATATLAQLRSMTEVVAVLAASMLEFAASPNRTAFVACPLYCYRNLPCSIAPDDELWAVSGEDQQGGGGVLEWCFDQADAEGVLQEMKRHSARFKNLKAQPWVAMTTHLTQEALAA